MPAYNFRTYFADLVESGAKRQTIRPERKRPTRPGDILYLYTGMRTKKCRLLRVVVCKAVTPITIYNVASVWLDKRSLPMVAIHQLVKDDGFASVSEFVSFFEVTYGLPFRGELIEWQEREEP